MYCHICCMIHICQSNYGIYLQLYISISIYIVTYDYAVGVLSYASNNYKQIETIDFLDQYLCKIINILGDQK